MSKYYYAVATREPEPGKFYAMVLHFGKGDNLASLFARFKAVNICSTKKEAEISACAWDESFLKNGTFAGGYPNCAPGYPNYKLQQELKEGGKNET